MSVTGEEAFQYHLHNFLQWVNTLTMEAKELCDAWGNYNVAWELVSDLKEDGSAVITMPCSYLDETQKQEVSAFIKSLDNIPKSLLISATSVAANQTAMSDPRWGPYRRAAVILAQILESAAARNKEYFPKES
jgi:hypothetical protein